MRIKFFTIMFAVIVAFVGVLPASAQGLYLGFTDRNGNHFGFQINPDRNRGGVYRNYRNYERRQPHRYYGHDGYRHERPRRHNGYRPYGSVPSGCFRPVPGAYYNAPYGYDSRGFTVICP